MGPTAIGLKTFAADTAIGHILPGGGKLRSAVAAYMKCELLEEVLQIYFQDTSAYNGATIDKNDSKTAIKYVITKKTIKSRRQAAKGTFIAGAGIVGAVAGATVGSVVPVAGTAAGAVAGGATLSTAATGVVTVFDRMARGVKAAYKKSRGTLGVHRSQAAHALYWCATTRYSDNYGKAADAALELILGEEYDKVMGSKDPTERIMSRIKSN